LIESINDVESTNEIQSISEVEDIQSSDHQNNLSAAIFEIICKSIEVKVVDY
jgi:hypothetical protein